MYVYKRKLPLGSLGNSVAYGLDQSDESVDRDSVVLEIMKSTTTNNQDKAATPFHAATDHAGCRSLLQWARCSPHSSMALSFRTDSSEIRSRSASSGRRNKISS